jgi:uridine kinase
MYDELVSQITQLLTRKSLVVVAISGHGGSGKSTLTDKLANQFGVADNQIIRIDGLHAKNYMQIEDIYQHHDWKTIMDLLKNMQTVNRLSYVKRDNKEVESIIDVPRPRLVILEGILFIRPEILPYVDVSVWIDCPVELATTRAKERNRHQGDSEAELALWDTKWVPEAMQYYKQTEPQKIASFIYKEYE